MKAGVIAAVVLIAACLALAEGPSSSRPEYFSTTRAITIAERGHQNYVVLDDDVWRHARPDLTDLRLYSGGNEVPFAWRIEYASDNHMHVATRILDLGATKEGVQFVVDTGAASGAHNRIELEISRSNFVAQAHVAAADDVKATKWVELGTFPLFELSRERLGQNNAITLASPVTMRYLKVVVTSPLKPEDIHAANVVLHASSAAQWRDIGVTPTCSTQGRETVCTWEQERNEPMERVLFTVDGKQNFSRRAELLGDKGRLLSAGQVQRVHLMREGRALVCDQLWLDTWQQRNEKYKLVIKNGDDPVLPGLRVQPQLVERRMYFDPPQADVRLYYGDEHSPPPDYEYARLFQRESNATEAKLSAEEKNTAYVPRPDERPWTDKHPAVLWGAMVAAVAGLGALALRGLKA